MTAKDKLIVALYQAWYDFAMEKEGRCNIVIDGTGLCNHSAWTSALNDRGQITINTAGALTTTIDEKGLDLLLTFNKIPVAVLIPWDKIVMVNLPTSLGLQIRPFYTLADVNGAFAVLDMAMPPAPEQPKPQKEERVSTGNSKVVSLADRRNNAS